MNRNTIIAAFFALVLLGGQSALAQSGYDLFQKGLVQERTEGDLDEAIRLYKQIVEDHKDDRVLTAKALVQMGQCYEKLGRAEARKAYERVVHEFADQPEPVQTARRHLEQLDGGAPGQAEAELVWTHPTLTWTMAPSPDGRYLAFQDADTGDLAIRDLKADTNRRLTHNKVPREANTNFVRFSPDGKWIAYDWYHDEEDEDKADLRIIGVDGSGLRIVYQPAGDVKRISPVAWFPDGKQILGRLYRDDGSPQAVVVSVADGSVRVIEGPNRQYFSLSLSPDGRYIAYDIWEAGSGHIVILAVDGGEEIPVVEHPADDRLLGWTPDGGMLVFRSNRRGQGYDAWGIQIIDGKPQGQPQCLKKNLDQAGEVKGAGHLTPDGSLYYIVAKPVKTDVYTAALDLETGKVTDPRRASERPKGETGTGEWSPDGKHLLYTAKFTGTGNDSPPSVLVIRSVHTGQESEIPLPSNVACGGYNMPWSPDGRSILVSRRTQRGWEFCRLDVPSGEITSIVPPSDGPKYPIGWSADGKRVFFLRMNPDPATGKWTRHILAHSLETGQEKELYRTDERVGRVVLSPDRQKVFFGSYTSSAALMVLSTKGGKPRELFRAPEKDIDASASAWTPDGRSVLFVRRPQGGSVSRRGELNLMPAELWRIPAEGGEPQKLELPASIVGFNPLRVHPDAKQIAFTTVSRPDEELWVMKSFLPDLASPQTLTGTEDPQRPFGLDVEVPDPEGDDVKEFAARVKLSGDDDDWNAPQWCGKIHQGKRGSLDGLWENRYGNGSRTIAQVKTVGDWVYILNYDWGYELIKARRQGNRLTGRYIGLKDPIEDWGPWVGLIVNDERIDGAFTKGRWDLRRDLLPSVELTSPASDDFAAPGEPVLLKANVATARDVTVRRVEFLIDGSPVGDDTNPPYQFNWDGAKQGSYWAAAKVYDSAGGTEETLPVNVMVGGLTRLVAHGLDNAEEIAETGSTYLTCQQLELGTYGKNYQHVVAIRFGEIGISKGTLIKKAYLQFTTSQVSTDQTDLVVHAELAANAQPFAEIERNLTSRRKTTTAVKWSPEPWNVAGERAEKQQTPDLSALIQEVVAQPDWQEGNAVVLIISGSGERDAASYDGLGQQNAPMLRIEY